MTPAVLFLPFHYLIWHYFLVWPDLFAVWGNLLGFTYRFFSLPTLARTFFSRWRRLGEDYPRGFDLGGILAALVVNTMMRLVGALFRLGLIVVGLVALVLTLAAGILFLIIWLVLPAVVLILVSAAGYLIFWP